MKQLLIDKIKKEKAIKFGDFTLKSGNKSSYFIDFGQLHDGESFDLMGESLAQLIYTSGIDFEVIFGPAYKGIPLSVMSALKLKQIYNLNVSTVFTRKEAKEHGEKGIFIGSELANKNIILVDDVLSYGTAIKQSLAQINQYSNAKVKAIFVALDRKEKIMDQYVKDDLSEKFKMPIFSVLDLDDLL